jgi:5-methylthioadenosine/S-adenosylhomocysteine deaminase
MFELIARYAMEEDVKLTIHAAESEDERNLLMNGEGFFTNFYQRLGLTWNAPHCSSIEFLSQTGVLEAKPLLAHCVTVSDADIELLARTGSRVAHCPKSNAKFGHGVAPFEKMLGAGVPVGLGSDSVASNNLCDLLEESRFAALVARNRPDRTRFITARDALAAATIGGAKGLGLDDKIGTLEAGKQADIAVVSLAAPAQAPLNDIEAALVFSSNARDVVMTMVAGETVYSTSG